MSTNRSKPFLQPFHVHLPELLKHVCTQCHGSCLGKAPSSPSSVDDDDDGRSYIDIDLDNKYAIIMEIKSRATKAKLKPEEVGLPGERMITNKEERSGQECAVASEDVGDSDSAELRSDAFFSVRSCFSRCSSSIWYDELCNRSMLEDFGHCDGWPFGLYRRPLVLPPLPSAPTDSWQWHKSKTLLLRKRLW